MAKTTLTATAVQAAKPGTYSDGEGMTLVVTATCKSWRLKYYHPVTKKRQNMSLGKYPEISLAEARKRRAAARELIAQGVDPAANRNAKAEAEKVASDNTFAALVDRVMELKRAKLTANHCDEVIERLTLHVLPNLGKVPVADIRAPFVINMLKPLEDAGKLNTLKRCCQHINEVMDFATNSGLVEYNPCAKISKVFKAHVAEHNPTVTPAGIVELVAAMDGSKMAFTTRGVIEWQLHTMVRPVEAASVRWDEIDMEARIWAIPANKMKMRRDHRVPLTDEMIAILERMRPLSGHRPYVFPHSSRPLEHMFEGTANSALKRMGYKDKQTAHGLRALASTTLNEAGFNPDAIEAALAHTDANKVRASYNRADYLAERVIMMRWWSAHIEKARQGVFSLEPGRRGLELVA